MSANKKNIVFIFIVILAFTVFFVIRGTGGVTIDSTDEGLTFATSAGSVFMAYEDMTDIQFFEAPDYGSGESSRGYRTGVWESPELGRYTAFLNENIKGCILFAGREASVAFNYESDAVTREFYKSIRELWLSKTGGGA